MKILIPLSALFAFCWLANYSHNLTAETSYTEQQVSALNDLTEAAGCDDWLCELEKAHIQRKQQR